MTPTQHALHQQHKLRLARMSNAAKRHAWNANARRDTATVEKIFEVLEPQPEEIIEPAKPETSFEARHILIQRAVANNFGLSRADLLGECRRKKFTVPRHIAIYLVHSLCKRSLPWIGRQFGGMDHSSVLYAVRKIEGKIEDGDQPTIAAVEAVKAEVEA